MQYWCIDGKYRIYVASHIHSIFTVNTPILCLSCNKICQTNVIPSNDRNDNGNPVNTSIAVPVRGVA